MNIIKTRFLTCLIVLLALTISGCSHKLRITNLRDNYASNPSPLKNGITIGVSSSTDSYESEEYIESIVKSLRKSDNFNRVIYPYDRSYGKVDYVVDISAKPYYSGKGTNFLVNWPGFLIFAPAIWGYGYNAEILTDVNVKKVGSRRSYEPLDIKANYNFRHAAMNRTWTEIGWFEVGLIPLISGIFFTQYDDKVTREFIREVSDDYGTFVSRKIVGKIGNISSRR